MMRHSYHSFAVKISCEEFLVQGIPVQPMPDGSCVAIAGELLPRRENWSQRIYERYLQRSIGFADELDGPFVVIIWDKPKQKEVVARDRAGLVPLLYYEKNGILLLSDHLDGLLAMGLDPQIEWRSVKDYFYFFWTLGNRTFLRGVKRFPAGTVRAGHNTSTYWKYEQRNLCTDANEAAKLIREAMEAAIKKQVWPGMEVGCHLSGGIDSSVIALLLSKYVDVPFKTYSFRVNGGNNETIWIQQVLERINSRHCWVEPSDEEILLALPKVVAMLGEPMCYPSVLSRYFLEEAAEVKQIFNGRGVDELFSGYNWHRPPHLSNHLERRRVFSKDEIRQLLPDLSQTSYDPDDSYMESYNDSGNGYSKLEKSLYIDYHMLLRSWLHVEYSFSKAFGRVAQMPVLDSAVLQAASEISSTLKSEGQMIKVIFKRAFSDILSFELLNRPKMGLNMPFSDLLRRASGRDWESFFEGIKEVDFPEIDFVYLKKQLSSHINGELDWGWQLWGVICYMLWKIRFFRMAFDDVN